MCTEAAAHSVADHGIADASTDHHTRARDAIGARCQEMDDESRAATTATPAHHVTELGAAPDS